MVRQHLPVLNPPLLRVCGEARLELNAVRKREVRLDNESVWIRQGLALRFHDVRDPEARARTIDLEIDVRDHERVDFLGKVSEDLEDPAADFPAANHLDGPALRTVRFAVDIEPRDSVALLDEPREEIRGREHDAVELRPIEVSLRDPPRTDPVAVPLRGPSVEVAGATPVTVAEREVTGLEFPFRPRGLFPGNGNHQVRDSPDPLKPERGWPWSKRL